MHRVVTHGPEQEQERMQGASYYNLWVVADCFPRRTNVALLALFFLAASPSFAQPPRGPNHSEGSEFFRTRIAPLLEEHCYSCHGEEQQESGLRLDTYEGLLEGGDTGDLIVGGEPEYSLLLIAVRYIDDDLQMPPAGKLSDDQIGQLAEWVRMGAPHPAAETESKPAVRNESAAADTTQPSDRFWAFESPRRPVLPSVRDADWCQTPVDHFVLSQIEGAGSAPAAPAAKRALIRRATFDLWGLPPSPEDVSRFVNDASPHAFARVVDRLLNSPHYGERWARHWLDVARYADSNGLDENIAHGNAWRYRDYVIASFNKDKPYDEFIREQIAGDLLPKPASEAKRHERLTATGFLAIGPKVLAESDPAKMQMDIIDEQVDTLGKAFLGMTLGCARCHDHKFDPISIEDYYALAGIFKSTQTMESFERIARWHENSVASASEQARITDHLAEIERLKSEIAAQVSLGEQRANEQASPGVATAEPSSSNPDGKDHNHEDCFPLSVQERLATLRAELARLEQNTPTPSSAMGVAEGEIGDIRVHLRGNHLALGREVPRGVPDVLEAGTPVEFDENTSGRLELANWLAAPTNPLTSRVIVNRVWRWHFGRGIVPSVDNFGQLGSRPRNQALLDWLAEEFVRNGWSIKSLHRTVMLSATYQMSSLPGEVQPTGDALDDSWSRFPVRRLEAEAIRDALLAVSGLLDKKMGGSLLHVANREFFFDHTSNDTTRYDSMRRSIYLPVVRNHLYDFFSLFDYSDASVPNGDRAESTVAPQALLVLNSPLLLQVASALAERTMADPDATEEQRLKELYLRLYTREPTERELARDRQFLTQFLDSRESWTALCHMLVVANEFIYVP